MMNLFVTNLLLTFILFNSYVQSEQDSAITSVETQYLTFDMAQYGTDGGVFSSPNFPDYYPRDIILFYQFKASIDYRVQVEIDFFHVRGVPPQCTHDYLDVFLNMTDVDLSPDQLLYRYCGRNKPPLLISLTNLLVLGFFTEDTQTERGFNGSFRFISAKPYQKNLFKQPCDYIFQSSVSKRGDLFTSTYPGTYLPWQFCNYSFIGQPNERIRIRFRDLMLFKTPNTQHCAVDLIKLYDNTLDPLDLQRFLSTFRQSTSPSDLPKSSSTSLSEHHISDLCGTYTLPLDVYSTSNRLLLYFISTHYAELTNEEQMQSDDQSRSIWRKGFYAEYEFLSSLTKLDFIGKNQSHKYLSGTECDHTIKSFSQGSGQIRSPNWPNFYKPQTSCTTYLLGLDDRYTLENVEIEFEQFDIDCQIASLIISNATRIYESRFRTRPSIKSNIFSNYYQQELDFKTNLTFCGHFKPEGRFLSKNALLKISFIPNDYLSDRSVPSLIEGGRFLAKYKFVKSYHQVTADEYDGSNPSACSFFYYQSRTLAGKFQPPRSSENDYFSNANCTFEFHRMNEQFRLLIWFDYFNIADDNYTHCPHDNLTYDYRANSSLNYENHPFVYCGYRNFPSPYLTDRWTKDLRIHFRSNDDLDSGLGFDGRYQFLNRSHSFFSSSCPTPFDPIIFLNETDRPSGFISSHGYPENVICEWSYRTSEGLQFNLDLTVLQIEGSKSKDPPQGCQSAVLRIYSEGRIEERCGTEENPFFFLTNSNWFTVQFLSFNRLTKEQLTGFYLSWMIIEIPRNDSTCSLVDHYIACEKTSNHIDAKLFCIHQELICNGSIDCQSLIDQDKLPSNCFERTLDKFPSKSSRFLREHYFLISIIVLLAIVILTIGLILIFLLIQNKRTHGHSRLTKSNLILRKHFDDQDSTGMSMLEQTVTTV